MKKPTRKTLVKKLDTIVSQIVRARDKKCITCGSFENLGCGHLITRSKHSVRWDLQNCNAQCNPCNLSHEYNPHKYTEIWISKYGLGAYKELNRKSNKIAGYSDLDLKNLFEYLTNTYAKKEENKEESQIQHTNLV